MVQFISIAKRCLSLPLLRNLHVACASHDQASPKPVGSPLSHVHPCPCFANAYKVVHSPTLALHCHTLPLLHLAGLRYASAILFTTVAISSPSIPCRRSSLHLFSLPFLCFWAVLCNPIAVFAFPLPSSLCESLPKRVCAILCHSFASLLNCRSIS